MLIVAIGSCGGGSSPDPIPDPGNPQPPGGAQGNLGGSDINIPVDPADVPQPEPILAALGDAPLGVNPAYNVQPAGSTVASHQVSKAGSALEEGEDFVFNWVTIAADGVEPDPEATELSFEEGQKVDLWMEYEIAENIDFERSWDLNTAGLEFTETGLNHSDAGTYEVKFDFQIPYGSATNAAKLEVMLSPTRQSSVIAVTEDTASASVGFTITSVAVQESINYPPTSDEENDGQGGGGGCMPEEITVEFNTTSVVVESDKHLSNVVLEFANGERYKFDDLSGSYVGEFAGEGAHEGMTITRCWVKSGCNFSGDGPGYGERFAPTYEDLGMAQMNFEDLLLNTDYDYNDFVGRMRASEMRNLSDELVQISLTVKAVARGSGHDADWQFNVDAAFPGATVMAIVDQYYADGSRHGPQRVWTSEEGASIPVFSPTSEALPNPPDHAWATNVVAGTTFVDGDYAEVLILLDMPLAQGSYTPLPYEPELKINAIGGLVYTIGLWNEPGDEVDSNGRPLAFIVPDTYAWPLEGKHIWNTYSEFNNWIYWINQGGSPPDPNWWDLAPIAYDFQRDLFN